MGLEEVKKAQALKFQGGNTSSTLVPGIVPKFSLFLFEYIYVLLQQLIQNRINVRVYHDRFIFYLRCSERLSLIYRSIDG